MRTKTAKSKLPSFEPPMLAMLTKDVFDSNEWLFEPKLDGIRALSYVDNGNVQIFSRRGLLLTKRYPELTRTLSKIRGQFIVDGEIVALDDQSRPSFQRLQERSGLTNMRDIEGAEKENPIKYYIFDIIFSDGIDLRPLSLVERKKILRKTIKNSEGIRIIEELGSNGKEAFKACVHNGLEGVVAKRLASPYRSDYRSTDWLKIKVTQSAEFLVCGYTKGTGSRQKSFGALILGEHNKKGDLIHVCSVGTGFNDKTLDIMRKKMKPLETKVCPFDKKPLGLLDPIWLKPELVAEIKFAERTKDGSLRVPVFMHLREDIEPDKVKPQPIAKVLPK